MYTRVKTAKEIENMRTSGRILALILAQVRELAREGVTGREIDDFVGREAVLAKAKCAFAGYSGFPGNICISLNDGIVHGIPTDQPFKKGDIVSFDFGISYNGMITDSAFTMVVDEQPAGDTKRLIEATETSLYVGLEQIDASSHVGDIGASVQSVLERANLGIIQELVGHGVGHEVHEMPDIPNYGKSGHGPVLKKNMTIAIEPMATLGDSKIITDSDGWTIRTADGSLSAHFEHTILVLEDGCEILTSL